MSARTCLLHVGTPKAGSTTIQGFLALRREALAARGIDVPLFPENDLVRGARALAGALGRETDPAAPATLSWRWLERRLGETDGDLCISRESFCMHLADPRRAAFARAFFERRGVRLKIVAYLRDSPAFLNANYTQDAKKLRLAESFEDWATAVLADPPVRYSYWRMFRHVLADDAVDVALRPLGALGAGGLIGDFLSHLRCADLVSRDFDERPFRNPTPGPKAIAAGLAVGRALAARGIAARGAAGLVNAFTAEVAAQGWTEAPFFGPDAALARRISERFAEGNEQLAQAAWGRSWESCAAARPTARNVFDPTTASLADRREVEAFADGFVTRFVDRGGLLGRLRRRLFPQRSAAK